MGLLVGQAGCAALRAFFRGKAEEQSCNKCPALPCMGKLLGQILDWGRGITLAASALASVCVHLQDICEDSLPQENCSSYLLGFHGLGNYRNIRQISPCFEDFCRRAQPSPSQRVLPSLQLAVGQVFHRNCQSPVTA